MTTKIDSLRYEVKNFTRDDKTTKAIDKLFDKLKAENALNFEAILPIRHVDMGAVTIHWDKYCIGTHFETYTWYEYEDPVEGWTELSHEEHAERLNKLDDEATECTDEARAKIIDDTRYALDRADVRYPELMWNTSWRPDDDPIDTGIAARIPQITWVQFNGSDELPADLDGKSYITLTSIGQDNGPALMAYVILSQGIVPEQYIKYWTRERSWFEHVVGKRIMLECAEKLGVAKELKQVLAKDKREEQKRQKAAERKRLRQEAFKDKPLGAKMTALLEAKPDSSISDLDVPMKLFKQWANLVGTWGRYTPCETILKYHAAK